MYIFEKISTFYNLSFLTFFDLTWYLIYIFDDEIRPNGIITVIFELKVEIWS